MESRAILAFFWLLFTSFGATLTWIEYFTKLPGSSTLDNDFQCHFQANLSIFMTSSDIWGHIEPFHASLVAFLLFSLNFALFSGPCEWFCVFSVARRKKMFQSFVWIEWKCDLSKFKQILSIAGQKQSIFRQFRFPYGKSKSTKVGSKVGTEIGSNFQIDVEPQSIKQLLGPEAHRPLQTLQNRFPIKIIKKSRPAPCPRTCNRLITISIWDFLLRSSSSKNFQILCKCFLSFATRQTRRKLGGVGKRGGGTHPHPLSTLFLSFAFNEPDVPFNTNFLRNVFSITKYVYYEIFMLLLLVLSVVRCGIWGKRIRQRFSVGFLCFKID